MNIDDTIYEDRPTDAVSDARGRLASPLSEMTSMVLNSGRAGEVQADTTLILEELLVVLGAAAYLRRHGLSADREIAAALALAKCLRAAN